MDLTFSKENARKFPIIISNFQVNVFKCHLFKTLIFLRILVEQPERVKCEDSYSWYRRWGITHVFMLGQQRWMLMCRTSLWQSDNHHLTSESPLSVYKQDQESVPLKPSYLFAYCWGVQCVIFLICWWKCTEVKKTPSWSRVCDFSSSVQDTCHCLPPLLLVVPARLGPWAEPQLSLAWGNGLVSGLIRGEGA